MLPIFLFHSVLRRIIWDVFRHYPALNKILFHPADFIPGGGEWRASSRGLPQPKTRHTFWDSELSCQEALTPLCPCHPGGGVRGLVSPSGGISSWETGFSSCVLDRHPGNPCTELRSWCHRSAPAPPAWLPAPACLSWGSLSPPLASPPGVGTVGFLPPQDPWEFYCFFNTFYYAYAF